MSSEEPKRRTRLRRWTPFLAGAALLVLGLSLYVKHLFDRGASMMVVRTVDDQGQEIGSPRVVFTPAPETVAREGLAQLASYVERLQASPARGTSLLIAPTDERFAVGLYRTEGQTLLNLTFDQTTARSEEAAVRAFFAARDLAPTQDYLAMNGGVPDSTRLLAYSLPAAPAQITELLRAMLRQNYHLREDEGMKFTLERHR